MTREQESKNQGAGGIFSGSLLISGVEERLDSLYPNTGSFDLRLDIEYNV